MNTLTGEAGLKLGPLLLETLLKHYFERLGQSASQKEQDTTVPLRKEDLLYDEAFQIVKTFMDASTRHTVEELQHFSNARTPTPPWVHLVRLLVPMSCCDEAADLLIKALGGEEVCKRVVGGTKWWQVRGLKGVEAEWVTAKKDWQEAKRKYKERQSTGLKQPDQSAEGEVSDTYLPSMDEMRCILYLHGGGYYFGSVDQERYAIQRFARKINGRVFAINYRLAPQYPFPCAIQDALAAYLFLIRPPEGSLHLAVKPEHIVVAGDSAGGGLTLALLQVIRDSGLPAPAGGVPISPWCDLTHSFPSIHLNTATDVIPQYGLSMHKPSTLWPPPSDELTSRIHHGLRSKIRQMARLDSGSNVPQRPGAEAHQRSWSRSSGFGGTAKGVPPPPLPDHKQGQPVDVGTTAPFPTATASAPQETPNLESDAHRQTVRLTATNGEELVIQDQIQLYAQNDQLTHPLVSSAMSYLGGLPPLLFIISDKEVLRDEGVYTAHKAACPEKYPIRDEQREMYPALKGIEERYGPTKVHVQVYDDSAHVLPILFSFTTPAKFCYRSVAAFCRHVTKLPQRTFDPPASAPPQTSTFQLIPSAPSRRPSFRSLLSVGPAPSTSSPRTPTHSNSLKVPGEEHPDGHAIVDGAELPQVGMRRAMSATVTRATSSLLRRRSTAPLSPIMSPEEQGRPPMLNTHVSEEPSQPSSPPPVWLAASVSTTPIHSSPRAEPVAILDEIEAPLLDDKPVSVSPGLLTPLPSRPGTAHSAKLTQSPPLTPRSGPATPKKEESGTSDVGGPRFHLPGTPPVPENARLAGDAAVYREADGTPWKGEMICERVSTQGVIRPLEPEHELGALTVDPQLIGRISELAARRYLDGRTKFSLKFKHQFKAIHKQRLRNLQRAREETEHNLPQLQELLFQDGPDDGVAIPGREHLPTRAKAKGKSIADAIRASAGPSWGWAWALDEERPPPSSIAARRDTDEARQLARVADRPADAHGMSGNTLWSMITTFLTAGPGGASDAATAAKEQARDTKSAIGEMMKDAEREERGHRAEGMRRSKSAARRAPDGATTTSGRGRRKSLSAALAKLLPDRAKSRDTRGTP